MIIGLTGPMGCGKGEIVKILEAKGFKYIRLSSMIREEARKKGLPETREMLQDIGNKMRGEGGVGVLAVKSLEKIKQEGGDFVVDGIRNPGEIDALKLAKDVHILGIQAGRDILVDRIVGRAREGDAAEREEIFMKLDREWGIGEPADGQQVGKCMEMTDKVIVNEGTLDELKQSFLSFYAEISSANGLEDGAVGESDLSAKIESVNTCVSAGSEDLNKDGSVQNTSLQNDDVSPIDARPSKDEYYMDLARTVARRATCLKVQIGAVIIRDDQVVATGYCGSPRGTKSSLEHGFCLRVKLGIPSGHRYEMCRSVHAEQNAIINAARSGTSLLGGDMYIYGELRKNGKEVKDPSILDAFPCFICKKMLINCGLKRVICSLKDGGRKIFIVDTWMEEWSRQDIIDDKDQYGTATKSTGSVNVNDSKANTPNNSTSPTIKIGEKPATHDAALD